MWIVPRSLLKIVAVLIAGCALVGLVLGFQNAPRKGRLPGESVKGESAEALTATDAKPLVEDAPLPQPSQADKKPDVKTTEVDPADGVVATPTAEAPAVVKPATKPAEDKMGDLLDVVTPPPEEPPH